ncbi:MAG: hypothetical protein ACHQKZ_05450 [Solirubrobacterales bacterium]|jgi:hypothetical protein
MTELRDFLVVGLAAGLSACGSGEGPPGTAVPGEAPAAVRLVCGTEAGSATGFLGLHRYAAQKAGPLATGAAPDRDEASVAILHDRGDLVIRRNLFDLDGTGVRFVPAAGGGYDVTRSALGLETPGTPLDIPTGGSRAVDLPFAFPFYTGSAIRVFVNADGNLTFGAGEDAPGERGLGRFLGGPPRIAPFYASLDPTRGGTIAARLLPDRATFLWSAVPGAGQINRNTFQTTLNRDGTIDFVFGAEVETREAVVGVSPGGVLSVTAVDLSAGPSTGATGAIAERFSETEKADLVSVTRRFLAVHPDVFEQIVIYTTRPLNPVAGTLAFEVNTRNDVRGIGLDPSLDESAGWGSGGALASVVYMDAIDPYLEVDGFEFLGHEVGHRWLARLAFRDSVGRVSNALLGRGLVHWSFFLNSDASVMEGNRILDRGGGRFETVEIAEGYSALDQYVMGLRDPGEVAPFFYVDEPDDFQPSRGFKFSSTPEVGVSFTGVRRDVRIEDVVAAMGPRVPEAGSAPRVLRQAVVLVADETAPATPDRVRAAARIRARFETYYREATGGRGAVDSSLLN